MPLFQKNLYMAFIQAMTCGTFSRGIPFLTSTEGAGKRPVIYPHNFLHGFFCPLKSSQPPKHKWKPSLRYKLKYSRVLTRVLRLLVLNSFLKENKNKTKNKQQSKTDKFRSQGFPLLLHPVRKWNKKIIFRVAEYSCLQSQTGKSQELGRKLKPR